MSNLNNPDENNDPNQDDEKDGLMSQKRKKSDAFGGKGRHKSVKMEEDENYPITDEDYGGTCTDKWEGDKWIWNEEDL